MITRDNLRNWLFHPHHNIPLPTASRLFNFICSYEEEGIHLTLEMIEDPINGRRVRVIIKPQEEKQNV